MGTSFAFNEERMLMGIKNYRDDAAVLSEEPAKVIDKPKNCRELITRVAERFAVTPQALLSDRRLGHLVRAREVVVLILRRGHHYSLKRIGSILNKHHTSIMYLEKHAAEHYKQSPRFREVVDELSKIKLDVPRDEMGIPL